MEIHTNFGEEMGKYYLFLSFYLFVSPMVIFYMQNNEVLIFKSSRQSLPLNAQIFFVFVSPEVEMRKPDE